ncbi:MAG: pyruvate dehydrogenase, partial [Bacteroidetes bacterium]|nr:pyruvate dehydrogenase [Bacteroidota bacterium]
MLHSDKNVHAVSRPQYSSGQAQRMLNIGSKAGQIKIKGSGRGSAPTQFIIQQIALISAKIQRSIMAEVILMPRLSDTMTEGVIAAWHKKV